MTVDDILHYKDLVDGDLDRIYVGGIMASLMREELWKTTGINPIPGILNKPGVLGDNNGFIIDYMLPDYHLFKDSNVKYSLLDSYIGYATRGCVQKCEFCGVNILEPKFREYRGMKSYVRKISKKFGEKQHLVLLDNNIVASKKFKQIIYDILDLGFEKDKRLNNKRRHVDFNQGTDARLLKEWHFKLLSKIAMEPLRIAFDHIKFSKIYINKIRLAAKYKIHHLSNYILYNFDDTPEDLWRRLKINIDLNKEYDLKIYSFPMKYIPLNAKDRTFIDVPRWNWQFIRNVQRILNVTKGTVMTGEEFFYRAFGSTEEEFIRILHMPEKILMNRTRTEQPPEIEWKKKFNKLSTNERTELLEILCENRTERTLTNAIFKNSNSKLKRILEFYLPDHVQLPFDGF